MSSKGIQALEDAFAARKAKGQTALMPYLMGGHPDIPFTERIIPLLAEAGADVIELGFPFSDPIADGPVVQAAGNQALPHFSGLDDYLGMVSRIRKTTPVPLVLMTHYNPIFRYGEEAFLVRASEAGLNGAIIPDLPVDEAGEWTALCRKHNIAPVLLEAPNTDAYHAQRIAENSAGFIYLVSLKGVTGTDSGLGENLAERVARFRDLPTKLPLAVGFGISTPKQAREVGNMCDGVVIGSALVRRISEASTPEAAEKAAVEYIRSVREALDA